MDMITLAMAKAYTDKKASGGAEPVVVDLDSYGITDSIMQCFETGGGFLVMYGVGTFWNDINTDRMLRLEMAQSSLVIDHCARMIQNGTVVQLSFNLTLRVVQGSEPVHTTIYVSVVLLEGGNTEVSVKVV